MFTKDHHRTLVYIGAAFIAAASISCSTPKPPPPQYVPPPAPRQQKQADPKVQQNYYDQGLQYYSKESYEEARKAFQKVVDISASTKLGLRAKENLKKIDQILKTLEEMKSK